jgi:hypothetical protein
MILHQYEYVSPHNYTKPTVSILLDELGDYLVEYLLEGIFPPKQLWKSIVYGDQCK